MQQPGTTAVQQEIREVVQQQVSDTDCMGSCDSYSRQPVTNIVAPTIMQQPGTTAAQREIREVVQQQVVQQPVVHTPSLKR